MRIAVDVQVSQYSIVILKYEGHTVIQAEPGELDKQFFIRIKDFNADLYVSPDYDWMNYALDNNRLFLQIRSGWDRKRVKNEILSFIKREEKLPKKERFLHLQDKV